MSETYELAALYYARNVTLDKAINPILILIGDEGYHDTIAPDYAKNDAKVVLPSRINTSQVFEELKQKYAVYLIRKPYGSSTGDLDTMS
ncbi:hypothetical protein ACI4CV_27385, partial [Klebsiella pneumoniae]|uniref:hypothetical protein n=1 Tax=Klebsiella pneumoniae TaxID=573 RepID=UPI0038520D76